MARLARGRITTSTITARRPRSRRRQRVGVFDLEDLPGGELGLKELAKRRQHEPHPRSPEGTRLPMRAINGAALTAHVRSTRFPAGQDAGPAALAGGGFRLGLGGLLGCWPFRRGGSLSSPRLSPSPALWLACAARAAACPRVPPASQGPGRA